MVTMAAYTFQSMDDTGVIYFSRPWYVREDSVDVPKDFNGKINVAFIKIAILKKLESRKEAVHHVHKVQIEINNCIIEDCLQLDPGTHIKIKIGPDKPIMKYLRQKRRGFQSEEEIQWREDPFKITMTSELAGLEAIWTQAAEQLEFWNWDRQPLWSDPQSSWVRRIKHKYKTWMPLPGVPMSKQKRKEE
ncbi:hypothetical protein OTU49_003772, partial [Cherax quadricarinatus]